jgi:hypothetical protein
MIKAMMTSATIAAAMSDFSITHSLYLSMVYPLDKDRELEENPIALYSLIVSTQIIRVQKFPWSNGVME